MEQDNIPSLDWEEWRDIPWYEGRYQVSSIGRVKSFVRYIWWSILNQSMLVWYKSCRLRKNKIWKVFYTHRLVAFAFIPIVKNKPFINHKNGVRIDNRLCNLEWCTQRENIIHAFVSLWRKWRIKSVIQYWKNWEFIQEYNSLTNASYYTETDCWDISRCCSWKIKTAWWYKWKFKI